MRKLFLTLALTFVLYYLVISFTSSFSNFDTQSYNIIGALTLNGKSIYPDPAASRHPYLPLFLYIESLTHLISSSAHLSQSFIMKIFLTLAHLCSIYAIYLLSKKNNLTTFLYAINPISLFITAFHGQFDILPIALMLFAILAVQKKKYTKSLLFLSLAITLKTWPILFIVPFLKRTPKRYYWQIAITPLLSILAYAFFFHTSLISILRVPLVYQGVGGIWGFGKIFYLITQNKIIFQLYKILFVGGLLFYSYKQKRTVLYEEILELMILFFIFTPGFGLQWLLWPTPFLFLTKKPFSSLFMVAMTICLDVAYLSWPPFSIMSLQVVNSVLFAVWPLFGLYYGLFFAPAVFQRK